jgi:hypothetical protein
MMSAETKRLQGAQSQSRVGRNLLPTLYRKEVAGLR